MSNKFQPLVSIIMTTFNRAKFIIETIQSIQQQTYTNWELVIADDGSSDKTKELVEQLEEPRIIYLYDEHSGNGGRLKNLAIQKSSGELLAFIDSDDLWSATKLEKQVAALNEFREECFCVTNGYNFKQKGQPLDYFYPVSEGFRSGKLFIAYFESRLAGFTQALMVRKKCLSKIGGFKELKSFSDIDCIVALAYHFPGIILYEPLVLRRLHDANYITGNWEKSYDEGIALIHENENKLPPNVYRNALFRLHINRGEKWLGEKMKMKAAKDFARAWKIMPWSFIPFRKLVKTFLN